MSAERRGRRRPYRRSLRTRVTVTAGLVIAAAVTIGILLLYLLQIDSVRNTVDQQLRTYVAQIAQASPTGNWTTPLPASPLASAAQAQVIADDGTVVAATRGLSGVPATFALAADSVTPVRLKGADGVIPDDVRAIAMRHTVNNRSVLIVAATPTGILSDINTTFAYQLILGFPIILILAALAVWILVGRALGPVERIRHAASAITSADLSRRVPEPGTDDEIGHLAQTMNQMLTRLENSARRQRSFVADASHELRSPVAAIRTTLDVALAHPDRAPWPTIAARASQQGERLEQLLQQLLLLAKADEHTLAGHRRPVDIHKTLREVTRATPTDHIAVELNLTGSALTIGNPGNLARLFRNVLENAIRYAAGTVIITTSSTPTTVEIRIADDGPGIPAADRERVFDRFVRLDSSRDRATGNSGLGLAIAREIAATHHGSIRIDDAPGPGANIVIELPRRQAPT
jgi:signal transduction histidine kinase